MIIKCLLFLIILISYTNVLAFPLTGLKTVYDSNEAVDEVSDEEEAGNYFLFEINAGSIPVLEQEVTLQDGDILKIRAQIEATVDDPENTNDCDHAVRQHIKIVVKGKEISHTARQNNNNNHHATYGNILATHHLPMYTDAVYKATSDETIAVRAQFAGSTSANPIGCVLKCEKLTYRRLIIEHYRKYVRESEVAVDDAKFLRDIYWSKERLNTEYDDEGTIGFTVILNVFSGDVISLWANGAAKRIPDDIVGYHSQKIMRTDLVKWKKKGASATENLVSGLIYNTHTSTAIDTHSKDINGVEYSNIFTGLSSGANGLITRGTGQIIATQFSDYEASDLYQLQDMISHFGSDTTIITNSGWETVNSMTMPLSQGDKVRATFASQLQHPDVSYAILCKLRGRVVGPSGQEEKSSIAWKNSHPGLEMLPFRNDLKYDIPETGSYTFETQVQCKKSGGLNPEVDIRGDGTQMIVDHFTQFGYPN